jgi:hypothetical protein
VPASLLSDWHDFFVLIGTAAVTLIGAMFVVVSIGIGFLTRERAVAIRTFLTPTVTHLSTVLFGCVLTTVPALDWGWLAGAAGVGGVLGILYSGRVVVGFRQHEGTDRSDLAWYAILPLVAYAVLLAAAVLAWRRAPASIDVLAAVLAFLLLAGIRNAWDMIVFSSPDPAIRRDLCARGRRHHRRLRVNDHFLA